MLYDIVATPAATPVTMPDVPTVAVPVALLLHTPPATELLNVVVRPTHIPADDGDIAAGAVVTVTTLSA